MSPRRCSPACPSHARLLAQVQVPLGPQAGLFLRGYSGLFTLNLAFSRTSRSEDKCLACSITTEQGPGGSGPQSRALGGVRTTEKGTGGGGQDHRDGPWGV